MLNSCPNLTGNTYTFIHRYIKVYIRYREFKTYRSIIINHDLPHVPKILFVHSEKIEGKKKFDSISIYFATLYYYTMKNKSKRTKTKNYKTKKKRLTHDSLASKVNCVNDLSHG